MKKLLLSTMITVAAVAPLQADTISDQIQAGLKAYENKEYKVAMEELKYASAAIGKLDAQENTKLLPQALDGWSKEVGADNSAAMAMLGGGSMTSAIYKKADEEIKIEIIANSPMIAAVAMMINNPMIAQADKNSEIFRHQGAKGIRKEEGSKSEITLLLAGQIMIKLTGSHLQDKKVLEAYLNQMDMKKIKNTLLQ